MSGFTNYGAAAILAGTALPQTLYVKHHTDDPGADATDNPCAETTREAITLEEGKTPLQAVNDAAVVWTSVVANETATYYSLWDAASGGNPWVVGSWEPPIEFVATGDVTVSVGNIRLNLPTHGS